MNGDLMSAENVTASLWVDVTPLGGAVKRTACLQTRLRRDDESEGGESSNSTSTSSTHAGDDASSSTSDTGGDSTSDDNGSDDDENSGAGSRSMPQVAFCLVL